VSRAACLRLLPRPVHVDGFSVARARRRHVAVVVALLCPWLPGPAAAEPATATAAVTLTEADVIRLARARDGQVALAAAGVAEAEAEAVAAGLYPEPSLAWSREHVPGAGADAGREDTFEISVPVEVSGRRAAGRALARAEVASAQAMAARARSEAVAAALLAFYEAIADGRRAEIAGQAVARLDEAARVLGRRHEQGSASGYERTRLELEAELARSELRQAEARAHAARAELALILGVDAGQLVLAGSLEPGASGASGATGATGGAAPAQPDAVPDEVSSRPSSRLLARSVAEARDARGHAGRAWIPAVSVSGGLRIADAGEARYGYVAGVALDLPLFGRGRDSRARAHAAERLAQARVHAAELTARRELLRARSELALAREELGRFDAATHERLELLVRGAESGYREGERSLIELLDAQRARTAVELRRLELGLAARRAEVGLRAAQGGFE
jgi:cobalt-zinc-cadmium efflux system outer membrane protein